MPYERFQDDELILRDELARDRTHLANERTMLAYLRTAVMLAVAGGTAIKLFAEEPIAVYSGWALAVLSLPVAAFGMWRFLRVRKSLMRVKREQRPE